jgi:stress response protein YsnF
MVQPAPDQSRQPCADAGGDAPLSAAAGRTLVVPQVEETAEISTRTIETGVVRITKHVHDVERTFQPELHDQRVRVDRVPVNRVVKEAPAVRTEGQTTIIPVVEEVMVKLLLLKEELHVTREVVQKPSDPQHVTLRREEVIVDRQPAAGACATPPRPAS